MSKYDRIFRGFHIHAGGITKIKLPSGSYAYGSWIYGYYANMNGVDYIIDYKTGNKHSVNSETICRSTGTFDSTTWSELTDAEKKRIGFDKASVFPGLLVFEFDLITITGDESIRASVGCSRGEWCAEVEDGRNPEEGLVCYTKNLRQLLANMPMAVYSNIFEEGAIQADV